MAIGKNKRAGKKQSKKKIVDPFSKKDWFDIKAPSNFEQRDLGKTPVTKYNTPKAIKDNLMGRRIWVSLGDLKSSAQSEAFRKFCFKIGLVVGNKCLTTFSGMKLTSDKRNSIVRKYQTLISARVDVRTSDNFTLRLFCIGFTKRARNQVKKTSYAKTSQVKAIRKKMIEVMRSETASKRLADIVNDLIPDSIAKAVNEECDPIYPLHNVFIEKAKVVKAPRLDESAILEMHGTGGAVVAEEDEGAELERVEEAESYEVETDSGLGEGE